MLEGTCPKCGLYRVGWALRNIHHRTCPNCGAMLEITEDGQIIFTGYSPFDAETYFIYLSTDEPTPLDIEKLQGG